MKTLLVRAGPQIVEKTLKGPWPPKLSYLGELYREFIIIFNGAVMFQSFSYSSALAVGSVLKNLEEDVEFLDIPLEFGIPLTEEMNTKRNKNIEDYIAKGGYDIVGISCSSIFDCLAAQKIAEAAKKALEDVTVVFGGYQAASDAYNLMEKIPAVDVIVLSDFEPIAQQLYAAFNGHDSLERVPNILYRENGNICTSERKQFNISPEDLPIYDFSLIKKYISSYVMFGLEASRGCPYDCSFCQEKVMRKSYTVKDPATAVDEAIDAANYVAQFVEPVSIFYTDPLWGANAEWVKTFCSHLADRRDEITSATFRWVLGARIDQFDSEQLVFMKKAGCSSITYGVESLSPTMLSLMQKTQTPQKYIASVFETVDKTLKAGMHTMLFFLFGLPGETKSTIRETMASIQKFPLENKDITLQFSMIYPSPGTLLDKQLHDLDFVKKYGVKIRDENDWEKSYIPRFTPLFDPSRDLSAPEITTWYLDLLHKKFRSILVSEDEVEIFRDIMTILDRDEISPDEITKCGKLLMK